MTINIHRRVLVQTPIISCIVETIMVDHTEMVDSVTEIEMPTIGAGWNFELFLATLQRANHAAVPMAMSIPTVLELERA